MRHQQRKQEKLVTRRAGEDSPGKKCWLFYGLSGTGKTTLAASFPGPVLLINITDDGDDSVEDVEGLEVFEPSNLEELEACYWFLAANPDRYATVIIDTITQMQDLIVKEVGSKKSKAKFAGKKPAGAWGAMTKQQWGEAADLMKTQINNFRGLPCHTVFLAQQKMIDLDDGGDDGISDILLPEFGPAVMKSVSLLACSSASFIGNTFIRTATVKKELKKRRVTQYCMRVGPNPLYITKTRKAKSIEVPDYIVNPTYDKLQQLRKGKATNGSQGQSKESQKGKDVQNRKSGRRPDKHGNRRRLA